MGLICDKQCKLVQENPWTGPALFNSAWWVNITPLPSTSISQLPAPPHASPDLCGGAWKPTGCTLVPVSAGAACKEDPTISYSVIWASCAAIPPNSLNSHQECGVAHFPPAASPELTGASFLSHHSRHPKKKGWRSSHVVPCNLTASWRFSSSSTHLSQIPSFSDPFISSCSRFLSLLLCDLVSRTASLCTSLPFQILP